MLRHLPHPLSVLVLGCLATAALLGGCDSTPRTPPIDEPIDQSTALEADERMRQSREELIRKGGSEPPRK